MGVCSEWGCREWGYVVNGGVENGGCREWGYVVNGGM